MSFQPAISRDAQGRDGKERTHKVKLPALVPHHYGFAG
jgi:hypothetical protein